MLAAEVALVRLQRRTHLRRADLAVPGGEGEHLVPAVLHGAGLMDVDVAALRAEHALVRPQQGSDHGGVGLRPAHEEMDLGVRAAEDVADHVRRLAAMRILPVTQRLFQVCLPERVEDLRAASFQIIAFEMVHGTTN